MKRNLFNIFLFILLLTSCRAVKDVRIVDTLRINVPIHIPESEVYFDSIDKMVLGDTLKQENDTIIVTIYKDTIKYKVKVKYKDVIRVDTVIKVDTIIKLKQSNCTEVEKNNKTFFEKAKFLLYLILAILIILLIIKLIPKSK